MEEELSSTIQNPLPPLSKVVERQVQQWALYDDSTYIVHTRPLIRALMHDIHHTEGQISGDQTVVHLLPDPKQEGRLNPLVVLGSGKCGYAEGCGGCAMCAFGEGKSQPITTNEIDKAFDMIINQNELSIGRAGWGRVIININAIGSFFGDKEMPPDMRDYIYKKVRDYKEDAKAQGKDRLLIFVTEARADDITEGGIRHMRKELGDDVIVEIGLGIESVDPLVREAIINKGLDPAWRDKVRIIRKYGMETALHFMLGTPFLSEEQAIVDVTQSIKEAAPFGERLLLMVMNKKPGTLVSYLQKAGQYTSPNVFTVAETLFRLEQELSSVDRKKISVFGLVSPKQHVDAGTENLKPHDPSCPCSRIFEVLYKWQGSEQDYIDLHTAFDAVPIDHVNKRDHLGPYGETRRLEGEERTRLKGKIAETYFRGLRYFHPNIGVHDLDGFYETFKSLDPEINKT